MSKMNLKENKALPTPSGPVVPKKFIGNPSLPPKLQSPEIREDNQSEIEDFPMIINTQRATYENLIADLGLRIERVTDRNDYLETFCEEMTNTIKDHNSQAEKEIVQLNNNIVDETKKIEFFNKKMKVFFEEKKEVMKSYNDKLMMLNEKFEKTRINLQSQIKNQKATVNVIEEYKYAEVGLKEKFESNEKYLLDKEEEMRKTLDEIKLKEKIHKESLKKESYDQILIVSDQFQHILKDTIPQSVQRLMRENIVLENELVRLWNDHMFMEDTRFNDSDRMEDYKERIKASKRDQKRRMITIKLQHLILKKLKNMHDKVKKVFSKVSQPPNNFEKNYLQISEKCTGHESTEVDFRRRKLEKLLHREKLRQNLVKDHELKSFVALNKCMDTLDVLKNALNSAMGIEQQKDDDYFKNLSLEEFSYYLLEVMNKFDAKKYLTVVESQETVGTPVDVYLKGDLGFDPQPIQFYETSGVKKIVTSSVENNLAILKEIELQMQSKVVQDETKKSVDSSSSSGESSSIEKAVIKEEPIADEDQKSTSGGFPSFESIYEDEMEENYDDYDDWSSKNYQE